MILRGLALLLSVSLGLACTGDPPTPPRAAPVDPAARARVLEEAAALYEKGSKMLKGGQGREAIVPLRQAIRLGHPGHAVHQQLGQALLGDRQVHEARGAFGMALSIKPGQLELLLLLARAQLRSGYPRRAMTNLRAALKKKPGQAEATRLLAKARTDSVARGKAKQHISRGQAAAWEGKLAEAVKAYHQAVRSLPDSVDANLGLGEALCKLGRHAEAVPPLRKVVTLSKTNSDAVFLLGLALAKEGKGDEGGKQLALAMSMRMHDVGFHLRAAGMLVKAALPGEAAKLLETGIGFKLQSAEDKARQLCALSLVHQKQGKAKLAAAALARTPKGQAGVCARWKKDEMKKDGW